MGSREDGRLSEVYVDMTALTSNQRGELMRKRVTDGIALLNEQSWTAPWYFQLSVNTLDIADPFHCVLGQLYGEGGYMEGLKQLDLTQGILFGFSGYYHVALTEIWKEEILKLRENHVQ